LINGSGVVKIMGTFLNKAYSFQRD
jgi:hypothetical protein